MVRWLFVLYMTFLLAGDSLSSTNSSARQGPVVRITPNMLLVNDATKLPIIYSRTADKSKYYLLGVTEKTNSVLQMSDHEVHAYYRKMIAGPVRHKIL